MPNNPKKASRIESAEFVSIMPDLFTDTYPYPSSYWTGELPATIERVASGTYLSAAERSHLKKEVALARKLEATLRRTRVNKEEGYLQKATEVYTTATHVIVQDFRHRLLEYVPANRRKGLVLPKPRESGGDRLLWRIHTMETFWLEEIGVVGVVRRAYESDLAELRRHLGLSVIWDSFLRVCIWFDHPRLNTMDKGDTDVPNGLPIRYVDGLEDTYAVLDGTEDETTADNAYRFTKGFRQLVYHSLVRRKTFQGIERVMVLAVMRIEPKRNKQWGVFHNLFRPDDARGYMRLALQNRARRILRQPPRFLSMTDEELEIFLAIREEYTYSQFQKFRRSMQSPHRPTKNENIAQTLKELRHLGLEILDARKLRSPKKRLLP